MSAIYANATKWILLLKYTAPSEQQTHILRFPLCSFWQHSFQWWFVFSFLYLFICITHCGEVDCDEDTDWGQSQREGGREGEGEDKEGQRKTKGEVKDIPPSPFGPNFIWTPMIVPLQTTITNNLLASLPQTLSCDSKFAFSKDKTGNEKVKRRWMSKKECQTLPCRCMFTTFYGGCCLFYM